jgi:hypothetical protein
MEPAEAALARGLLRECHAARPPATAARRAIRRRYSKLIADWPGEAVRRLARAVCENEGNRWIAYELLVEHSTFATLGERAVEALGRGVAHWWSADAFARTIAGPAWQRRQIRDRVVVRWAKSDNLWWRRIAAVSTVALNMRSQGGTGDTPRTLRICRLLTADRKDMVVKGVSWALRELVIHDPASVRRFLADHHDALAARITREVTTQLTTGFKTRR